MRTLRDARNKGGLDEFIAEHENDTPGDKCSFDATLSSMAGKSKLRPETSKPDRSDG